MTYCRIQFQRWPGMNPPPGLTPRMLWTCVSHVGSTSLPRDCMHRCSAGSCQGRSASRIRRCQPRAVSACVCPRCLCGYSAHLSVCLFFCMPAQFSISLCFLDPPACNAVYRLSLFIHLPFPFSWWHEPDVLCLLTAVLRLLPQVLKKDGQHVAARGMWDVLRRGTSQVLFSDLTEVAGHFFKLFC